MIDDTLYEKIRSPEGSKRTEKIRINDHLEIEYEITIRGGQEEGAVKSIYVTSNGTITVVADGNVVAKPQPVFQDDYCY